MSQQGKRSGKKRIFKAGILLAVVVAGIHTASALTLDRSLQHKEIVYTSPNVSQALDGYTAVFLTDIHAYPEEKLTAMVDEINRREVDLVLTGGDFWGQEDLDRCLEILSEINAPDGSYGVAGNHDRPAELEAAMERRGMTLLQNQGTAIREGLFLSGAEDFTRGSPNTRQALQGAGAEDFVLLLAHNPDLTMTQDVSRADLTLSGHTHGGQVTLFGLWAPALPHVSKYGHRFKDGWCKSAADTDVFVSRGVWHLGRDFRVFARPQVIYVILCVPENE